MNDTTRGAARQPGETATAVLLTLNVFLLLLAYYLLKVAREPLILGAGGGAEVKSYSAAGQAVLLIFVTYGYGALAGRLDRVKLIGGVTAFFISNLLIFSFLSRDEASPAVAVSFYLWLGIFNMMAVAQFWAFTADVYTEERGKRMLPIVGIGSSLGAVAGSYIGSLAKVFSPAALMLIAAGLLAVCLVLTVIVDRIEQGRGSDDRGAADSKKPVGGESGWKLLIKDRYLLLIGALMLAVNWVNSTGEYILDRTFLGSLAEGSDHDAAIQTFKGQFFTWVNLVGLGLQVFAVRLIIKYLGVRKALFIMPIISLISYGTVSVVPILMFLVVAKVAENSLDYSLQNTARHSLWLVTSREAKYKVKQVVDSFLVRAGDVMSAGIVAGGTALGLGTRGFSAVNTVLVGAWLTVVVLLGREHKKRAAEGKTEAGKAS